jgi:hypothetical protein
MEHVPATGYVEPQVTSFDGPVGRRIIDTHIWAVREGLRGTAAYELFDNYCQRLTVHGVPLWRAHAAMETLHPQWSGYGYTWRRDLNAIQPERYADFAHALEEGDERLVSLGHYKLRGVREEKEIFGLTPAATAEA